MKQFFAVIFIILLVQKNEAQFNGTKWKTTLPAQPPIDVIFNFSADSINVLTTENYNLETLRYAATDSVLTLKKLHGQTGCDTTATGSYTYKLNGDELWLNLVSDNCDERAHVMADLKLTKTE